jgi:hypothetical protein
MIKMIKRLIKKITAFSIFNLLVALTFIRGWFPIGLRGKHIELYSSELRRKPLIVQNFGLHKIFIRQFSSSGGCSNQDHTILSERDFNLLDNITMVSSIHTNNTNINSIDKNINDIEYNLMCIENKLLNKPLSLVVYNSKKSSDFLVKYESFNFFLSWTHLNFKKNILVKSLIFKIKVKFKKFNFKDLLIKFLLLLKSYILKNIKNYTQKELLKYLNLIILPYLNQIFGLISPFTIECQSIIFIYQIIKKICSRLSYYFNFMKFKPNLPYIYCVSPLISEYYYKPKQERNLDTNISKIKKNIFKEIEKNGVNDVKFETNIRTSIQSEINSSSYLSDIEPEKLESIAKIAVSESENNKRLISLINKFKDKNIELFILKLRRLRKLINFNNNSSVDKNDIDVASNTIQRSLVIISKRYHNLVQLIENGDNNVTLGELNDNLSERHYSEADPSGTQAESKILSNLQSKENKSLTELFKEPQVSEQTLNEQESASSNVLQANSREQNIDKSKMSWDNLLNPKTSTDGVPGSEENFNTRTSNSPILFQIESENGRSVQEILRNSPNNYSANCLKLNNILNPQ